MSVVSELRELALELEADADRYGKHDVRTPEALHLQRGVMNGLRAGAQRARLRALRAEHSVLARTDERPRFAQLRAPQRPSARIVLGGDLHIIPPLPSEFEAPVLPVIKPPAELMTHRVLPPDCEPYTCAGCGRQGVWHRGILTPPDGSKPERFCRTCKESGRGSLATQLDVCSRCGHTRAEHGSLGCDAADDCNCGDFQ